MTAVVAALYPDCKYFEGPENEPAMNAATAALMEDFADAVHAGHADAKAIGPSFVDILNLAGWDAFLAAGEEMPATGSPSMPITRSRTGT